MDTQDRQDAQDAQDPSDSGRGSLESLAPDEIDADIQALRKRLPTLEAVERRRGHLWAVAAILLVSISAMVFVLLFVPDAPTLIPESNTLRAAAALVSLAFILYVSDQERRMRVLSRALVEERVLSSVLNERVRDLATLSRVGQVVNSVLTTDEVLHIILRGARELTGAVTGSVMLVDEDADELVVEVATGTDAAPAGARQALHAGIAGRVAETREPILISGEVNEEQVRVRQPRRRSGGSSVISPMLVGDQLIGVLALERPHGAPDFTQWELRAVSLFANHAATAVINAKRYESERENVSRLADMIERRSEFVATLVHDLKAPLTAILGYTKLLRTRSDQLGEEGRHNAVERIETSSQDLLGMVNDVLRSASFEAAEPVRTQPIRLLPFLHDLVEAIQSMAAARDGQPRAIRVRAPEDVTIQTDPSALRSVLQNLLENAVKYSPAGSPIEIEVTVRRDELQFSVRDYGRGIPEDEQDLIFERFRRQRPGEAAEGVGLGLYIVRSLVKAQGGEIAIESVPGQGSTFHVTIPERHPSDRDDATATTAVPPPPPSVAPVSSGSPAPAPPPPTAPSSVAAGPEVR